MSSVRSVAPLEVGSAELRHSAASAVIGYRPEVGDRVLVTRDDHGDAWIIGVVTPRSSTPLLDEAVAAEPTPVQVHDKRGSLLFEYDPSADRATVYASDGDLELTAVRGALRLSARDGVEISTDGNVKISGGRSVELVAAQDGAAAQMRMEPGEVSIVSALIATAADRVELVARAAGLKAHTVETKVERAQHIAEVLEVRAGRIVERARDAYREVERLSQTRAGRLKLVAKKTAQLVGENTLLKARDRMKVKGEQIHLA